MKSSTKAPTLTQASQLLMEVWCAALPARLNPFVPQLAEALADSTWTAPWPRVTGFGPLVMGVIGFLSPFLMPGIHYVFTESIVFLLLVTTLPFVNGAWGSTFFLGFVLGDVLADLARRGYQFDPVAVAGSQAISYLLLALLMLRLPLLARRLARGMARRGGAAAHAALAAIAYGLLVYLWCQATIVLIRPVFTWLGGSPTVASIQNVQTRWQWLVAAAVVAAVARFALERLAMRDASHAAIVDNLRQRSGTPEERGEAWAGLPLLLRVTLATLVVTLLLAGTYESWLDAGLVAMTVGLLGVWRAGLFWRLPDGWTGGVAALPALARFSIAGVIGFFLARVVIGMMWNTQSLRPVMIGAVLTLIIFYLFSPHPRNSEE